ncbi:MAG TPA: hypothetical protein DD389_06290 [Candidatus Marinimicrobia bacterium]|nr:hypothetical protein [Candidatus Neomarinimicrobiota bacterium]
MSILKIISFSLWIVILFFCSCAKEISTIEVNSLFTLLPSEVTGIHFENKLADETKFNVFKYRNYYNGGGVAVGDINNDGLSDIYLTGNHLPNKLFLNEGNFHFRDITQVAGVFGQHKWSTGVAFVDINGDQLLDIYVCNSGNLEGDDRANELFINQGNNHNNIPVFKEAAAKYGLNNKGFSTHAAFFDYDRDGDLDMYLLNNAFRPLSTFDLSRNLRNERDQYGGDCLYRNDDGIFTDVSAYAGIYGSVIGFGLGLTVSDVNNDGWLDIYVANDFFERDYLYMNNQDGTFVENLEGVFQHTSLSSMGSDIADINNDGFMDIFTTDMLPEDDIRLKTTFTFETFTFNEKKVSWDYYHQLSQNTFQINNGYIGANQQVSFSDVGLLAGVAATDWTWGVDIVDLDNDGLKDLFMCNGIFRDVTNQDYLDYLASEDNIHRLISGEKIDFPELIEKIPSTPLSNYIFKNEGNLKFKNMAKKWDLDVPSFSNSLAYGDLDGDGDNDLVINNVNQPVFVYRNETDTQTKNHYLKIQLKGSGLNRFAIGARIKVHCAEKQLFVLEQSPMKAFQSSNDYTLTFGLGQNTYVDSLIVIWPDGQKSKLEDVPVDTMITLLQSNSVMTTNKKIEKPIQLFQEITDRFPLQHKHEENDFIDFQREPLIPHKLSTDGPKMAVGDVNGDGLDDIFIGGAKGYPGRLYIQQTGGQFISTQEPLFEQNKISEDMGAVFFDADADGDQDLYVISGGNEFSRRAPAFQDRLYINDGLGFLSLTRKSLPVFYESGSCVKPGDFDGDGDQDLFVGTRSIPWRYGQTPMSYLLQNDGQGHFSIVTQQFAPSLINLGMVTDAVWADYDNDNDLDLIVVGEWMPITILKNNNSHLINVTEASGLDQTHGWWNCVISEDINGDGFIDFVAGNIGHNTKLKATSKEPVIMYISDFDGNGTVEQILCNYQLNKNYPVILRSDLIEIMPKFKEKFPTHADYAGKVITEVFTTEQLEKATTNKANTFSSSIFYGDPSGIFIAKPLPLEAQRSPVYAIMAKDFDRDGSKDLLMAGNLYGVTPQLGRYDASYGTLLYGNALDRFIFSPMSKSGLQVFGQVRDISVLRYQNKQDVIVFAKNDSQIQVYKTKK